MDTQLTHDEALKRVLDHDLTRSELLSLSQVQSMLDSDEGLSQKLDELLRVRGLMAAGPDEAEEPVGGYAAFEQRLAGAIGQAPIQASATHRAVIGRLGAGFAGGVAAAAVLIFAVLGLGLLSDMDQVAPLGEPNVADASRWLPDSPGEQKGMLAELASFYDGRATWLATTGRDVRMGLADHRIENVEPLVTRLSLAAPNGEVLSTDLVLYPGQTVSLAAPRPDGPPVRYTLQVHPPNGGRAEATLSLTASVGDGPTISTELPLAGESVREIGRVLTDRGQYQLRLGMADNSHQDAL